MKLTYLIMIFLLLTTSVYAEYYESEDELILGSGDDIIYLAQASKVNYESNTLTLQSAKQLSFIEGEKNPSVFIEVGPSTIKKSPGMIEVTSDDYNQYTIMDSGGVASIIELFPGETITLDTNSNSYTLPKDSRVMLIQYGIYIKAIEEAEITPLRFIESEIELTAKDAQIDIRGDGWEELINAGEKSTFSIDKNSGLFYSSLGSRSNISFLYDDMESSFMLERPETDFNIPILINKIGHEMPFTDFLDYAPFEGAFIDPYSHKTYINGILDYSRFDNNTSPINIIDSNDRDNKISLDMDNNNIGIDIKAENKDYICTQENILLSVQNSGYNIVEVCNPKKNKVERYLGFKHVGAPDIINTYHSDFGKQESPIIFKDDFAYIKESKFVHSELVMEDYETLVGDYHSKFKECTRFNEALGYPEPIYEWFIS